MEANDRGHRNKHSFCLGACFHIREATLRGNPYRTNVRRFFGNLLREKSPTRKGSCRLGPTLHKRDVERREQPARSMGSQVGRLGVCKVGESFVLPALTANSVAEGYGQRRPNSKDLPGPRIKPIQN